MVLVLNLFLQVLVKKQHKARVFQLTRSLKSLGRSVGRKNRPSIARQAMKDVKIRKKVIEIMGKELSKELKHVSSLKVNSLLRDRTAQAVESFSWSQLNQELNKEAPATFSLLQQCAHVKRRTRKGKGSRRSARRTPSEDAIVGLCMSILLRGRSQRMNLVQRIVSMLLFGSHAPKQVRMFSVRGDVIV